MARPSGSRDKAFEEKKQALVTRAREHLSQAGGRNASWRDLASASGVSPSTLAHYFGDRQGLIKTILEYSSREGDHYLAMAARAGEDFRASVFQLVGMLGQGLDRGVLSLQVIGLTEGLSHASSADAYLGEHLEPVLGAISLRLDTHVERGQMRKIETRFAAISLLSPMLIARLHQLELGGKACYPMSLEAFDETHADAFVRGYAAHPEGTTSH